jgi:hypothetical protein
MPLLTKYKILLVTTFCVFVFSKSVQAQKNISGTYVGFNLCEIASYTITLTSNKKFEQHYTGHLLTNSIQKGNYKTNNDTLTLMANNKEYEKYIISGDSLYRAEDVLCKPFCLKKQISK